MNLHDLLPAYAYTLYWSVLDFPCGVITQGLVNSDETNYQSNSTNSDHFDDLARKIMRDSAGLPVGV